MHVWVDSSVLSDLTECGGAVRKGGRGRGCRGMMDYDDEAEEGTEMESGDGDHSKQARRSFALPRGWNCARRVRQSSPIQCSSSRSDEAERERETWFCFPTPCRRGDRVWCLSVWARDGPCIDYPSPRDDWLGVLQKGRSTGRTGTATCRRLVSRLTLDA